MAKITLWGIEKFLQNQNKSVFDGLVLPDGIVKDNITNNILLRAGEFEVLYSDPVFLSEAIALWGRKHYRTFSKWYEALQIEYNPLENYDRIETWTDTHSDYTSHTGNDSIEISNKNDTTHSGTESSTASSTDNITGTQTSNNTVTSETINQVSAFDSSTFSNKDKQNVSDTAAGTTTNNNSSEINSESFGSNSYTDSNEMSGTQSGTNTFTNNSDGNSEHTGRLHGNIGVTTSQQMLQSELDIAKWNLIDQITDLYISEFCIAIY